MTREEKLEDIKAHPDNHKHTFEGLSQCCFINGAIDTMAMEMHEKYSDLGSNGGQRCDVTRGPCSCGAWH